MNIFLAIVSVWMVAGTPGPLVPFFGETNTSLVESLVGQQQEFMTIGTGSVTGVYYPAGEGICRLVNKGRREHKIRCSVESTGGSIANLNSIRDGDLDFGIVQSDWQYHGYKGTSLFAPQGPNEKLRAIFSLHTEPFNIVASSGSKIQGLQDLKGTRVNIGNPGSGDRATMGVVMDAVGWQRDSFRLASELRGSMRSQALCDKKIDAFIYVVGHPNGAVKEATTSCDSKLVPVVGRKIDELVAHNPFYAYTSVPAGMYRGQDQSITSFATKATMVTSSDVSNEVVYNVVKAVFENFDILKRLHPAFATLKKDVMVKDGLSIPLHPGAEKFFKEVGTLK